MHLSFKLIILGFFLAWFGLANAEETINSDLIKKLIHTSDEIIAAELIEVREDVLGIKTVYHGVLEVEETLSSSFKKGDKVTVFWEKDPLTSVSHQAYKNVRAIWFLSSAGGILDANSDDRIQNLSTFEHVYRELNKRTTRVFVPNKKYWLNENIPATLIIRNIEEKKSLIPSVSKNDDDELLIDERINLNLYPITSYSKDKTIIGKVSQPKRKSVLLKPELTIDLVRDGEVRVEVDLNSIFEITKAGYYSLEFYIKDYPGQLIGGFEVKVRPKVSEKLDFLTIAKDRFAPVELQKTVRILMETVGETDPVIAWEILKSLSNLSISGKGLQNISPLAGLSNLEFLDLSNNNIGDLNAIRQMRELKVLDLSHNNIDDITPLRSCNSLEYLNLSYNAIISTEPINRLVGLSNVNLSRNLIQEIDLSEGLKSLKYLDISYNLLVDIKPLSRLLALQKILLQGNQIKNLEPMIYSYNLELLDVTENPIAYIDNLDTLMKEHKNVYGATIKLDLKHDLFKEATGSSNIQIAEKNIPLPNMDEAKMDTDEEGAELVKESIKLPSFAEIVEKDTGITAVKPKLGKVSAILENANLILVEFKTTEDFKVDEQLVVYRDESFIGMIQIIEVLEDKVVAKIVPELLNDKELKFQKDDLVKKSTLGK